MQEDQFNKVLRVAVAFKRAHAAHPDSRALDVLHARVNDAIQPFMAMLDEDQKADLLAAAPKSPPPNPEG